MGLLNGQQMHRAAGVLLTMASGDALGAGYEFAGPYPDDMEVLMEGGGPFDWRPGEWTDDTQMALVIADVAISGVDLRSVAALDAICTGWIGWMASAADVGAQTRSVLSSVARAGPPTASELLAESSRLHERTGHTAGNGSLMRTAPVALAYLDDPEGLTEAATTISSLTHFDPEAAEACVLWCHLIRHAVLTGELDAPRALGALAEDRAEVWQARLKSAESMHPADFTANGWVVEALQAAWCSIVTTANSVNAAPALATGGVATSGEHHRGGGSRGPEQGSATATDASHVQRALEAAVRGGRDTDTVAAIAGALLGARYGASAVPAQWRRILHGWPGLRARDLIARSVLIATKGQADPEGWPGVAAMDYSGYAGTDVLVRHPHDSGLWLGGVGSLRSLPVQVDAVVSLCRLGADEVPAEGVEHDNHVEVWLVDTALPEDNPHLQFVLRDTAEMIARLRAEGRIVLLHCVQAQSRTPTVAALHSVGLGIPAEQAWYDIVEALPAAAPNVGFQQAVAGIAEMS